MSTVALPRWVVATLVGACALCLVAVAFLLGRVTAPPPAATPAGVAAATAPAIEATGSESVAGVPAASRAASSGPTDAGDAPTEAPASGPQPLAAPPAVRSPDAAAVEAYFRQMDAVAAEAKTSQDPQAVARGILDQAMSGNTSSMETMIATQRSLESRLAQITPPPSCREHHQRSVRLFGRAITLLERTRDAMSGQGASDLGSVAGEGRAIEAEARALDALANDLRRAAGLAPVP